MNLPRGTSSKETDPSKFDLPPHLLYLDSQIQALASRELLREGYAGLIVEMPPRHGKSETCSHYTPPWYLGAFPDHTVALCSYEADFAAQWGRKARNTFEEFNPKIFGLGVDQRSSAAERWSVRKLDRSGRPTGATMGGMFTAGAGGPLTGRGANLLIVDDPIKNAVEAASPTSRERIWNWWVSTARTRLEPDGVILIIMTRWHEDDLVGRLIQAQEDDPSADRWVRIKFPAVAEEKDILGRHPGDALWPQRYDNESLDRIKASVGSVVWSALYQQRPAPLEGGKFQADWFEFVDRVPPSYEFKKVVRYWDFAATEMAKGKDPDFTVGCKVGLHESGQYYVLDVQRFRESPAEIEKRVRTAAELDGTVCAIRMEQEPGSAGIHMVSNYGRKILRGYNFKGIRSTGSKELRADVASAAAERGDVKLARGRWNTEFLEELIHFPFMAHDDQVDAFSGALTDLGGNKSAGLVSW